MALVPAGPERTVSLRKLLEAQGMPRSARSPSRRPNERYPPGPASGPGRHQIDVCLILYPDRRPDTLTQHLGRPDGI
jgi:hypothetical protein